MPSSHSSKILAIHSGGIGDLLLTLPALRAFRQAFSNSQLELLGFPERLSLIAHDLEARSIHSTDQSGMAFFYIRGETLPSRLVDFFSSFSTALVFGQSHAQTLTENLLRAGLKRAILLPSFPPEGKRVHMADALLEGLRSQGIQGLDLFRPLRLPKEAISLAEKFSNQAGWKKEGRILAIHSGSGGPAKNWSPEKFAAVADWAGERALILLISGPAEDGAEKVRQALKKANPFRVDSLHLPTLAAVLQNCTIYLGNDSGITHLAAALGVPTIALFGPTDPAIWGPWGPQVQIISGKHSPASGCSPDKRCACCRQCLDQIDPELVKQKLACFLE